MPLAPLKPEQLCRHCDPGGCGFETTSEVEELDEILGQDRAVEALEFGIGMTRDGYNLFALGPTGTDKYSVIRKFLDARAGERETPPDCCYVFNFEEHSNPHIMVLPPGRGRELRKGVDELIDEFRSTVPAAFESDDYRARRSAINQEFKELHEAALAKIEKRARDKDLAIMRTPTGFAVAAIRDGEALTPEAFRKLDKADRDRIESDMEEIQNALPELIAKVPPWERQRRARIRDLNRDVIMNTVATPIETLCENLADLPPAIDFLNSVRADIADHVDIFVDLAKGAGMGEQRPAGAPAQATQDPFARYRVNVIVDNGGIDGAPVIFEDNPTHPNLVGRVEQIAEMGTLVTDFTLIKPGALHRANGGYLILDARKLLLLPMAWETLKRTLRSREIRIESMAQSLSLVSTVSLEPQPVPLDVKVVLLGDRLLYYILCQRDPEFGELFKTAVDFDDDMDWTDGATGPFARLIATMVKRKELRPFSSDAVARIIEHSARLAGDSEKLSIRMEPISDLLRESDYWAEDASHETVTARHVEQAITAQLRRAGRLREKSLEAIDRGTVLIDTDKAVVGQVNGLSVLTLGNYAFGKPSRITATVRMGRGKVIDIEREVALGGPIHSKGVLILSSFLGARYAEKMPLSLAASIVFEQSYGGVDGDSASSTELYSLLSALSGVPIKQSFAVTGSVNQRGQVQAIGGVNEKIEGFFDVCKTRGLSGEHAVLIPISNVKHLMLRHDIVTAVGKGDFHIYAVESIDQGIELLTGVPAGEADEEGQYPEGSINHLVAGRLADFAQGLRAFSRGAEKDGETGDEVAS